MASDGSRADSSLSENSNAEISELSGHDGLLGIDLQNLKICKIILYKSEK